MSAGTAWLEERAARDPGTRILEAVEARHRHFGDSASLDWIAGYSGVLDADRYVRVFCATKILIESEPGLFVVRHDHTLAARFPSAAVEP